MIYQKHIDRFYTINIKIFYCLTQYGILYYVTKKLFNHAKKHFKVRWR